MRTIFAGETPLNLTNYEVDGQFIDIEGEKYYKISNYDTMAPFFMTITSDSDHWMFISSNGGLTCGRKNRENALFPYYTDDKIHDSNKTTGPKSIFLIQKREKTFLWEPFSSKYKGVYHIKRNIYKNVLGNKIIFEEINESLQISYTYAWKNSDKYGFIKESRLTNLSSDVIEAEVIDGLTNLLPYGVTSALQSNMSTLVDGYKKCELLEDSGVGIFTLSSILTDRAEPSEALKASVIWCSGLNVENYLLSTDKVALWMSGEPIKTETILKGRIGSYLLKSSFRLKTQSYKTWLIVADVSQNHSQVIDLLDQLTNKEKTVQDLQKDIDLGTKTLQKLIASADGIQQTGNLLNTYRHLSNTLFNLMRGGIFYNNYVIPLHDFKNHLQKINGQVYIKHLPIIEKLATDITYTKLIIKATETKDADFIRLCMEYLPLTFSRRHGDPSRPWNFFEIDVKQDDGSKKLNYQGNWRDIFQNWEALCYSFPNYAEGIIAKFVNASTADGYNPYRITKNGIDWEILDPDDPWSNIGYWGDHQIIYLQKLLEVSSKFNPAKLYHLLNQPLFVYANVPYRIKAYNDILKNPYDTIVYDNETEKLVAERFNLLGSDGKLIFDQQNQVYKVTLAEKLLTPLLAKLSNFVPHGGIWLNTQRPEWNDANNALVGYGLSMVTVYYLRRYIKFLINLFHNNEQSLVDLSTEVFDFFENLNAIFQANKNINKECSPKQCKLFVDALGQAGTDYRNNIYTNGFKNGLSQINSQDLINFLSNALTYIDATISSNKKTNGLYHSYNLIDFKTHGFEIMHLNDMLEGQVALLSSGYLTPKEAIEVLDALRNSKMYRADQNSFTLYPDKELPGFLKKNNIPVDKIEWSDFLIKLANKGDKSIIEKDKQGTFHFNGTIKNANQLRELLISKQDVSANDIESICELYVNTFNHRHFTGRSGTFFKFEGLGSIYWHMVSKLVLAIQENYYTAINLNAEPSIISQLKAHYYKAKDGLGASKNPAVYGAFPTDPYSHTPGFAGVQQPGMTGQVKEDFITRFGELGLTVENGQITFDIQLLKDDEFIQHNSLEFTFCSTPIKYIKSNHSGITVFLKTGEKREIDSNTLDQNLSQAIFDRSNKIQSVVFFIK